MWTCPLCNKKSKNPSEHWDHMKEEHPEYYNEYYALRSNQTDLQQGGDITSNCSYENNPERKR